MKRLSLSLLLFAACPLWGQDVKLPDKIDVRAGRMVKLTATATEGFTVFWDTGGLVPGQDVDFFKLDDRSALALFPADLFAPGGPGAGKPFLSYRIGALIAPEKNKLLTAYTTVTVASPVPVPPVPPVPPGPVPPGPVPPGPAPIPADGLRVLIIEESAERSKLPAGQVAAIFSKTVRDYLKSKCAKDADNPNGAWRIFDKDVDLTGESKLWQDAMKRPRSGLPWLIVSNPAKGGGFEGPLPADVNGLMELLKKWGD